MPEPTAKFAREPAFLQNKNVNLNNNQFLIEKKASLVLEKAGAHANRHGFPTDRQAGNPDEQPLPEPGPVGGRRIN
jgi:hypothetical protein